MNSTARTPTEHYAEAARLLAAAESSRTAEIQCVDAAIAIGHALLALAPRRARRQRSGAPPARPTSGGSPRQRWLHGHNDDTEGDDR
jgi:hypothetical protein